MKLPGIKIQRSTGPNGERLITMNLEDAEKLATDRLIKLYSQTFADIDEITPSELNAMSKSRVEVMLGGALLEQTMAGAIVLIATNYFDFEMGGYIKKAPVWVESN